MTFIFSSGPTRLAGLLAVVLLATGCAGTAPQKLSHTPEFAPVLPPPQAQQRAITGAIFQGRASDNWFGHGRRYQVGDILTVLLNESTQAARQQSANVSREASNTVVPEGVTSRVEKLALPGKVLGTTLSGVLGGIDLRNAKVDSSGTGQADQRASLSGAVSVSVVEVLANGNLMVRGEKQLALTEGAEVIQVSGIIRPDDISPNNTVQSRRLANAQIAYRGTGDMANAARPGWGTSVLLKLWPF